VVIIVKENHTFDNYFGTFPGANGVTLARAQNPPPNDPDHRHQAWMARGDDTRYQVQYTESDIGGYFDLARRYTLCDNYFSEVAGPSTPNHLMLICADSPVINKPHHHYRPTPSDRYQLPSLPAALDKAGLSWGNYGGYAFAYIDGLHTHGNNHGRDRFAEHARSGQLPAVSWVYGDGKTRSVRTPHTKRHRRHELHPATNRRRRRRRPLGQSGDLRHLGRLGRVV
jgi:phospholipase C